MAEYTFCSQPTENTTPPQSVYVLPTAKEFTATDKKLSDAANSIKLSRQMLSSTWGALAKRETQLQNVQTANIELLNSYVARTNAHKKIKEELQEVRHTYHLSEQNSQQTWNLVTQHKSVIELLEGRVKELENEKMQVEQEHQRALKFAAERISASERKLDEMREQQGGNLDPCTVPQKSRKRRAKQNAKEKNAHEAPEPDQSAEPDRSAEPV